MRPQKSWLTSFWSLQPNKCHWQHHWYYKHISRHCFDMPRHCLDISRYIKMASNCVDASRHSLDMQIHLGLSRHILTLSRHM